MITMMMAIAKMTCQTFKGMNNSGSPDLGE